MALNLNFLHEEIEQQRQRQRDPLKIGMMVLTMIGVGMFLYYMWNAYQTLEIKSRLNAAQADWAKVEPKVTAAKKRAAELNSIIGTTKVLNDMMESRFYWAPLLEQVAKCVAPNTQLTSLEGSVLDDKKGVSIVIEGTAAGREPRAAAEDLRQMLLEQLGQTYKDVKIEFKALEDLDTIVAVSGTNMAMARYSLVITLNPDTGKATAAPAPVRAVKTP